MQRGPCRLAVSTQPPVTCIRSIELFLGVLLFAARRVGFFAVGFAGSLLATVRILFATGRFAVCVAGSLFAAVGIRLAFFLAVGFARFAGAVGTLAGLAISFTLFAFAIGAFALFFIALLFAAFGFRFVVGGVLSNSRHSNDRGGGNAGHNK